MPIAFVNRNARFMHHATPVGAETCPRVSGARHSRDARDDDDDDDDDDARERGIAIDVNARTRATRPRDDENDAHERQSAGRRRCAVRGEE